MGLGTSAEGMAADDTGKATAFRGSDDIDKLLIGEDVDQYAVSRLNADRFRAFR